MTAKNLDDQFGRPPVNSIESLYWVMGYMVASRGDKMEDWFNDTSKNSTIYFQRGYRARRDEMKNEKISEKK
jgi:hypothetical protein